LALALVTPATAEPYASRITIGAGSLSHTLHEISRQTGTELLFDPAAVAGMQARRIDANSSVMAALQLVLAGTGLSVRRAASGALIIEAPATAPLAKQDAAVPDILVVGRRTQNADIRRQETDIQPYHVISGDQIVGSHADNIGQYFGSRVTTNASVLSPGAALGGTTNSAIDLRGLGTDETLVLIDGRRMPGFNSTAIVGAITRTAAFDLFQADLNALPLHAIDRIEILTGTAGGIYGYGALGGVVNVVLAHDRPGAEFHVSSGMTTRGDAGRVSLEARVEFSPDHGATTVTVDAGLSRAQPLTVGQRDFLAADRREAYRVDPYDVLNLTPFFGNSIGVFSALSGETLTLKSEYGGTALGSSFTYISSGFEGSPGDLATALRAKAGQIDLGISDGETASYIQANPDVKSLLMNVRHQFGGGIEAYFDGVMLWNHGHYVNHGVPGALFLTPDSPGDPFEQDIFVYFPTTQATIDRSTDFNSSRFTAGLVAPILFDWRATVETTWGGTRTRQAGTDHFDEASYAVDYAPFGGWAQFQAALHDNQMNGTFESQADTRYREQSLKLAGPVFRTAAGTATLALLAEHRGETALGYTVHATGDMESGEGPISPISIGTTSAYAELRAPIFGEKAPLPFLRGLEMQLAIRHDSQSDHFALDPSVSDSPRMNLTFLGTAFTAGAKVSPVPWLMLRGSFATGETPPALQDLTSTIDPFGFLFDDPKRPTDFFSLVSDKRGGSPALRNIRATTASIGLVLTPWGSQGLRASLDYSHVRKTHAVEYSYDDLVLAHEDMWPERVQREPLSAEDRALGDTGGVITLIDSTAINGASLSVQTFDARLDWSFAMKSSAFHLYGSATYNFGNRVRALFAPDVTPNGYDGGPLTWRANMGVDWSLGSLTIGANAQYFAGSSVFMDAEQSLDPQSDFIRALQGSDRISSQTYVDLRVRKRLHLGDADFHIDLGVNNIFDAAPPRVHSLGAIAGGAYSPYGDPRGRRFDVSLSTLF
jgi:iron complex outermembrane receptor protein